jgi:hypothetical protein
VYRCDNNVSNDWYDVKTQQHTSRLVKI